ncbi:MAG: ABC transporter ATP-binding protein [Bradyrhizobium sp.]
MDEPLSNLDARLRGQMRAEIARMQKISGITTVYVTHDQVEAMTMGDRVAVMKGGILQQLGTPRSLYDRPANIFVGSFMGTPAMNLLAADLLPTESGPQARIGQASILFSEDVLKERPRIAAAAGTAVVLGIRPEVFQPTDAIGSQGRAIAGTVAFIEDLGADLLVHVDVEVADHVKSLATEPDEVVLSAPRLRMVVDGTRRISIGERLSLAADPARIHLFDAATEVAIRD